MNFFEGVATSRNNLFEVIRDNAVNSGWTLVRDTISSGDDCELILEIPQGGYVGFKDFSEPALDMYHVHVNGYPTNPSSSSFYASDSTATNSLDTAKFGVKNCAMKYWMSINDRRIVVVVKVGISYEHCYAGRLLTDAPALDYPMPLFIGGTFNARSTAKIMDYHVSSQNPGTHKSCFFNNENSAYVYTPDGTWEETQFNSTRSKPYVWPTNNGVESLGLDLDGKHTAFPMLVVSKPDPAFTHDAGYWHGYLEGVYATSSEKAYAEDIVQIGFKEYTMFLDCFRTEYGSHWLLQHE